MFIKLRIVLFVMKVLQVEVFLGYMCQKDLIIIIDY